MQDLRETSFIQKFLDLFVVIFGLGSNILKPQFLFFFSSWRSLPFIFARRTSIYFDISSRKGIEVAPEDS